MDGVFVGSEAMASGTITRGQLRSRYRPIFPNVYQSKHVEPSLHANTVGAWLWSKQRGAITGRAAAALHGALWVDETAPVELLWQNCNPPPGLVCRDERFTSDEIVEIDGMAVASIIRTAFDLGRHLPRIKAVQHLDALARATGLKPEHVLPLTDQYAGARGVRRLRRAVALMDAGAESPQETWTRLVLIDGGFARPTTQIPVPNDAGGHFFLDMGWEDIMLAVEYDGDHHRADPMRYARDIARLEELQRRGWTVIRVIAGHRPAFIRHRVRQAWDHRETEAMAAIA
jgi:very-short-patch-repair endonuclease